MREAKITADVVHFKVIPPRAAGANGLNGKGGNALAAKPCRTFLGQAWKVSDIAISACCAVVKARVEKNGILRLNGDPWSCRVFLPLRLLV